MINTNLMFVHGSLSQDVVNIKNEFYMFVYNSNKHSVSSLEF